MSDMNDILVPLGIGTASYLLTNSNVMAGVITIAGTYAYFQYFKKDTSRNYLVDGSVNLSLNQTSSDPTKVLNKPSVMEYDTLGSY